MVNFTVISEEIIKPSSSTPTHLRYLKTSLFDHANNPVLMPLIFFFSNKHTPSSSTVVDGLRNSFPTTLSVFYPLAGRALCRDYIDCNDDGVPYVQAKIVSTRLLDIVHNADVFLLDKLLPTHGNEHGGFSELLMTIQVTTFSCGGVAIGVKTSHALSDAFSMAMFVKTWASIARGDSDTQSLSRSPIFEIWNVFPPPYQSISSNNSEIVPAKPNPDIIKIKPVTNWFMFSKATCEELQRKLCLNYDDKNLPSLTLVLSAFIWSRVKLACKSDIDKSVPHEVYHAVNIRSKVINTLPSKSYYYFGNLVVNALAQPSNCDDNEKSLCNSFIATMEGSIKNIMGKTEFIDGLKNGKEDLKFMSEHFERASKGEVVTFGFSSLRSLPVYEADFGWGKPVWVTSATLVFNDIVLMIPGGATSENTYVYVNLSPDQMAKLVADKEFLSYVSKSSIFVSSRGDQPCEPAEPGTSFRRGQPGYSQPGLARL